MPLLPPQQGPFYSLRILIYSACILINLLICKSLPCWQEMSFWQHLHSFLKHGPYDKLCRPVPRIIYLPLLYRKAKINIFQNPGKTQSWAWMWPVCDNLTSLEIYGLKGESSEWTDYWRVLPTSSKKLELMFYYSSPSFSPLLCTALSTAHSHS